MGFASKSGFVRILENCRNASSYFKTTDKGSLFPRGVSLQRGLETVLNWLGRTVSAWCSAGNGARGSQSVGKWETGCHGAWYAGELSSAELGAPEIESQFGGAYEVELLPNILAVMALRGPRPSEIVECIVLFAVD